MGTVFAFAILIGILITIIGMREPALNKIVKYGILIFPIGMISGIANSLEVGVVSILFLWGVIVSVFLFILGLEDPRIFNRNNQTPTRGKIAAYTGLGFIVSLSLMISTCSSPTAESIDLQESSQANVSSHDGQQAKPIETEASSAAELAELVASSEVQDASTSEFDWDAFDASPERAKLSDDVIAMQNNRLEGAHFLPVAYGTTTLENFMRENKLKFSMASLDCFSSDTHCSLTIHITREGYPSKAHGGDPCGSMASWSAPYTNLKA